MGQDGVQAIVCADFRFHHSEFVQERCRGRTRYEKRGTKERRRRQVTSPKKGHMHGVIPISQRGRQERGQGHVREGDGDGHSERGSCAYAWRKGKGHKSPRGRRDAFWVLDGARCAEMGGCAAARRGEETKGPRGDGGRSVEKTWRDGSQ